MKKVIGIYGLSGSGKSTFSKRLTEHHSCSLIDADKIGKEIMEKGSPILAKVEEVFGKEYLFPDGTLNRKKLGKTVFSDKSKLELLNSITKPEIERILKERIENISKGIVIVDCALIEEFQIRKMLDELVLIKADEKTLINRLVNRENIEEDIAKGRLKLQSEKGFKSYTRIIENNSTPEEFIKKADDFINEMKGCLK